MTRPPTPTASPATTFRLRRRDAGGAPNEMADWRAVGVCGVVCSTVDTQRQGRLGPMVARVHETERFWGGVEVRDPESCWPWSRSFGPRGYGQTMWGGRVSRAHRVSWSVYARVSAPRHLLVCHTCNNRSCCNPAHLYLGTAKQNTADIIRSGRHSQWTKTHCIRGHEMNSIIAPLRQRKDGRMFRDCRVCIAIRQSGYRKNRKAGFYAK